MKPASLNTVTVAYTYSGHWRQVDKAIALLNLQAGAMRSMRVFPSLSCAIRVKTITRSPERDALMDKKRIKQRRLLANKGQKP